MARVFNIYFRHGGNSYTALVYVSGNRDSDTSLKITTTEENIQICFPNGDLVFPISEVLKRLTVSRQRDRVENATVHITENIYLQLMNTSW